MLSTFSLRAVSWAKAEPNPKMKNKRKNNRFMEQGCYSVSRYWNVVSPILKVSPLERTTGFPVGSMARVL